MTAAVWTTTATSHRAVYRTYRHASVNLCLSQPAWRTTTKRREQNRNLFVWSGKSEAEVTNNRRLRLTYCTIEANYWQTRSIARPLCDSRATYFVSNTGRLFVNFSTANFHHIWPRHVNPCSLERYRNGFSTIFHLWVICSQNHKTEDVKQAPYSE